MPCSESWFGRGELRRSIGMVSLNFLFYPLLFSFLLRFIMTCFSRNFIKLGLCTEQGTQGVFFSICAADSCFFFAFRLSKSRDRSDCTFKAVYYSQIPDFKMSSLLLFPLVHESEGVRCQQSKELCSRT